ncbi:FeoA family protein [Parapedomonas caeni]|jgi:ferrous iron transport protein A
MTGPTTLGALRPSQRATILAIDPAASAGDLDLRLHEMGFDEGVDVEMLHRGPFGGDPVAVRVGGCVIAMRQADAAHVHVEVDATKHAGMLAKREAAE